MNPRIRFENLSQGWRVVIGPSRAPGGWLALPVVLLVLLLFLYFGLSGAMEPVSWSMRMTALFRGVACAAAVGFGLYRLLWTVAGRESVAVDASSMTIERCLGPWSDRREIPREKVRGVYVTQKTWSGKGQTLTHRNIALDCENETIELRSRLTVEEAQAVMESPLGQWSKR